MECGVHASISVSTSDSVVSWLQLSITSSSYAVTERGYLVDSSLPLSPRPSHQPESSKKRGQWESPRTRLVLPSLLLYETFCSSLCSRSGKKKNSDSGKSPFCSLLPQEGHKVLKEEEAMLMLGLRGIQLSFHDTPFIKEVEQLWRHDLYQVLTHTLLFLGSPLCRVYVCHTHTHTHAHTHTHMHTHTHTHTHAHAHTHTHTRTHTRDYTLLEGTTFTHTHTIGRQITHSTPPHSTSLHTHTHTHTEKSGDIP